MELNYALVAELIDNCMKEFNFYDDGDKYSAALKVIEVMLRPPSGSQPDTLYDAIKEAKKLHMKNKKQKKKENNNESNNENNNKNNYENMNDSIKYYDPSFVFDERQDLAMGALLKYIKGHEFDDEYVDSIIYNHLPNDHWNTYNEPIERRIKRMIYIKSLPSRWTEIGQTIYGGKRNRKRTQKRRITRRKHKSRKH